MDFSSIVICDDQQATLATNNVVTLFTMYGYIDGLVQDCSNSIANTLELLQPCTKPLI